MVSNHSRTVVNIDSDKIKDELAKGSGEDWKLQIYDESTTHSPEIDREFKRLLVLKQYNILDTAEEVEFEEITRIAKELFNVPIAVVSLVDMGRQWFKSINGLEAKETPRCVAFCSHVVNSKNPNNCFIVTDATKDERFKENPLVTDGPRVRFYAGAPIYSPEKHILGSLCIIDFRPRPQGLSQQEKNQLLELASEVVLHIITRQCNTTC